MYYVETSTGRRSFLCVQQAARKALQHNTLLILSNEVSTLDPCTVLRLAPGY